MACWIHPTHVALLVPLLGSVALAACGPSIGLPADSQGGGGTGEGNASAATTGSTSSSPDAPPPLPTMTGPNASVGSSSEGSTGSGGSTGSEGSTGAPIECEGFASDPDPGEAYGLTIHNVSDVPLYFQPVGCAWRAPFVLRDEDGNAFAHQLDACAPLECDALMEGLRCDPVRCPDCAQPLPVMLYPGGSWTDYWGGLRYDDLELPASCAASPQCAGSCTVARELGDGAYSAELQIFEACEGECVCEGDPDDPACYLISGTVVDPVTMEIEFVSPGDLNIVVDYTGA